MVRKYILLLIVLCYGCFEKNEVNSYVTFKIINRLTNEPCSYVQYTIREYEDHMYALAHRHKVSEGCSNKNGEFSFRMKKTTYYDLEMVNCDQSLKFIGIRADTLNTEHTLIIKCKLLNIP